MIRRKAPHVALVGSLAAALCLGACADYPKDIGNNLDRVEKTGVLRAGIVLAPAKIMERQRALARHVAQAHDAQLLVTEDSSELLVNALQDERVDLLIGRFATNSPLAKEIALTDPAGGGSPPKGEPVLRAAVKNGENQWLLTVNRDVGAAQ